MPDKDLHDVTRRAFMAAAGDGALTALIAQAQTTQLAPPDAQPPNLPLRKPVPKQAGWAIVGHGQLAMGELCRPLSVANCRDR
jgi:hypothetical protein